MEDKCRNGIDETIAYYDHNAAAFIESTINANLSELYKPFEGLIHPGAKILDLGCGSGRDSKYFVQHGYKVVAVDPSLAMCEYTKCFAGISVFQMKAEDLDYHNEFDAVWACASLLHLSRGKQRDVLMRIGEALKPCGICYCSWKYGTGESVDGGRRYTYYTDKSLRELFDSINVFEIIDLWVTNDVRREKTQRWVNVLARKAQMKI